MASPEAAVIEVVVTATVKGPADEPAAPDGDGSASSENVHDGQR